MSTEPLSPSGPIATSGGNSDVDYASPQQQSRTSVARYLFLSAIVALLVLGMVASLAYIKYAQIAAAMAMAGWSPPPVAVVAVEAKGETWQPFISTTGTVVAKRFVMLQNESEGTIQELNIQSGQVVEQGEVLVRLDTSVEASELRAAVARQKLAELQLDRAKRSSQLNAASANELDQAKAALDEAVAMSQQLQARIDRKTIRAPFKASVGLVDWQPGQYLPQGTNIAALTGVEEVVYVDFAVQQEMAGKLPTGSVVQVSRLDAPQQPILATITGDDLVISEQTRTTRTRAKLSHSSGLRPGMSLKVHLPAAPPQVVVTVPATAIRRAAWGDFVYIVATTPDGKQVAQQRKVIVGPSVGERFIIRRGIDVGTKVVADGSFKLKEGAELVMPGEQPTATQPAK